MKLEVEIDLTDAEWDRVKEDMENTDWACTDRVLAAVLAARDALRPIRVGDRVRIPNSGATDWVVRFIDDDGWLTLRRTAGSIKKFYVRYHCEPAGVRRVTDGEA